MRAVRLTWTIGGAALVLCGVIGMLGAAAPGALVLYAANQIVYAGAVLLFAVGLSREASVVRRGRLGVSALAVVALWPFVAEGIDALLPPLPPAATFDTARSTLVYVDMFVSLAAALVAVVRIGRARTVPRPWNQAPLWALIVFVATWVLPQAYFVTVGPAAAQSSIEVVNVVAQLGFLARTLGLGILALVLAARVRPDSVEVLRSP